MEKTVLVIGHRNPDTDSVCSAIAYAYLKQQLGLNAVPHVQARSIRKHSLCWNILAYRYRN